MNFVDNMRPSTYKVNARWIPAIMIALPGIILLAGMLYKFMPWNSLVQVPLKILSAGASTFMVIGVASIVLFSEKIRNRGKHLEDEYFHKSITFPTTDLLLWSNNEIEPEIKDMLYKAVYRDYGIGLCSREEENNDIEKARRLICSAVNQIRESVKDGRLLIVACCHL